MKTYAMCTLGCKVNIYEAEAVSNKLRQKGLVEVSFKEKADVYVIFTCAVTNTAESKSRKMINQALRRNEDALICVVGCLVQIQKENLQHSEKINLLVGSSGKEKIADLIEELIDSNEYIRDFTDVREKAEFEGLFTNTFDHHTRAYLKVQDGCNQFCTYCIIPYARGVERSLDLDEAVNQAKELSKNHKEIVLTGIHTGRYGKEHSVTLVELIKKIIEECDEIERLRISSIEISEITDELLDLMKDNEVIARHLHIPLQSGNDETLKRMNRPYSTGYYRKRVNEIRNRIPNISISTDLIVGFQGESEVEFENTMKFLIEMNFSFIHCFPYSKKSNTKAELIDGSVDEATKKSRVAKVLELSEKSLEVYSQTFIDKEVAVLVERVDDKYSYGYTSEYIMVKIDGVYEKNTIMKCVCTHILDKQLYGKGLTNETE